MKTDEAPRIDNTQLLADTGLKIVHIMPDDDEDRLKIGTRYGMTVAFRGSGNPVIEIATALRKEGDVFNRRIGTRTAVQNFLNGHTIHVPIDKRIGIVDSLKLMFL